MKRKMLPRTDDFARRYEAISSATLTALRSNDVLSDEKRVQTRNSTVELAYHAATVAPCRTPTHAEGRPSASFCDAPRSRHGQLRPMRGRRLRSSQRSIKMPCPGDCCSLGLSAPYASHLDQHAGKRCKGPPRLRLIAVSSNIALRL